MYIKNFSKKIFNNQILREGRVLNKNEILKMKKTNGK
jgi:hypothetical protein